MVNSINQIGNSILIANILIIQRKVHDEDLSDHVNICNNEIESNYVVHSEFLRYYFVRSHNFPFSLVLNTVDPPWCNSNFK